MSTEAKDQAREPTPTPAADRASAAALRRSLLGQDGATVWFTGLPAAGKTTLSIAVEEALLRSGRLCYRLDGDELRKHVSNDLGFDRASRAENVRRVANVARLMADAGLIALVALVSPYAEDRQHARELHAQDCIPFIEVFLDTPIELCRERDPKHHYTRATQGELPRFTGVDDPYERPQHPELRLDPGPLDRAVDEVLAALSNARERP
jgi:bifunctional enzyme CysN/CysC